MGARRVLTPLQDSATVKSERTKHLLPERVKGEVVFQRTTKFQPRQKIEKELINKRLAI